MLSLASATWTQYYGDGSAAADWPSVEQWRSFNELYVRCLSLRALFMIRVDA